MKVWPDLTKLLRRSEEVLGPVGMEDRSRVSLEYVCGFEMFNDQPYQCYETWCCGLKVACAQKDGSVKHFRQYEHATKATAFAEMCYPEDKP